MRPAKIAFVTLAAIAVGFANASPAIQSQDGRLQAAKAAVERIREDDIRRDVSYLASDANMGRRTPHPGVPSPGYRLGGDIRRQAAARDGR